MKLITTETAAEILGVRPKTLRNWRFEGRGDRPRPYKIGRLVRYELGEVEQWAAARRVAREVEEDQG